MISGLSTVMWGLVFWVIVRLIYWTGNKKWNWTEITVVKWIYGLTLKDRKKSTEQRQLLQLVSQYCDSEKEFEVVKACKV